VEAGLSYKATRPAGGGGYAEKCRRINLQNQQLEFKIEQLQRQYVKITDVERWGDELSSKIREIVSIIPKVAPEVVGCSVPDAETRLKRLEAELLTRMHTMGNG